MRIAASVPNLFV